MTQTPQARPAIFLDRDGTIIEEVDHLSSVKDLVIFDFAGEALRLLKGHGFLVIVVTNQSGISRGYFGESDMRSIHEAIDMELEGLIDGYYFCPHRPDEGCDCRKPGVGMITDAIAEHSIDVANSWMVGDKKIDIETGFNAGATTAMVMTGYGQRELGQLDRMPDIVAGNLLEAARQICSRDK